MKRTIYVVDDQSSVLDTVVFALRALNPDWEVTPFSAPVPALEAIKAKAPDVVLTDQQMPDMLGSELLEQVRNLTPTTVRIIMSGCVAQTKLTLITSAHQYLGKPFDANQLKNVVERSLDARERVVDKGMLSMVTSIRSIPSLPQVHHSLLAELEDIRNTNSSIAKLIGDDPGLSIKLLQLANSSLFSRGNFITNLDEAVSSLGTDTIAAVILSQSIFKHYETLKGQDVDLMKVWAHCWETACLAQKICREKHLGHDIGDEAFLAGLLHEVGRFVLIDNFPDQYKAACQKARQTKKPLGPIILEMFQANPSQLSGYVLELWGLPGPVVNSITYLDNPEEDPTKGFSMTTALYVANKLASRKVPADAFPLEDWKTAYIQSAGCLADLLIWEKELTSAPQAARS
jgi:HD-like signal output (HDOD) protein